MHSVRFGADGRPSPSTPLRIRQIGPLCYIIACVDWYKRNISSDVSNSAELSWTLWIYTEHVYPIIYRVDLFWSRSYHGWGQSNRMAMQAESWAESPQIVFSCCVSKRMSSGGWKCINKSNFAPSFFSNHLIILKHNISALFFDASSFFFYLSLKPCQSRKFKKMPLA